MTRIVEIERCGKQCRYYYDCYISQKKYCDHPDTFQRLYNRKISISKLNKKHPFPDWCPLEEKEE